ncbi:MAG: DUF5678 domain-containing protein [Nitrososphaerales archaeon]
MLSEKVSKALEKYEGMWVAVTEEEIVANGTSAKNVHEEAKRKTSKEVIVFKVPLREEEYHVLCLL